MTTLNRRFLISILACTALAILVFLPGIHGSFVFDDEMNIVRNPAIHIHTLTPDTIISVLTSQQPGGMTRILPTLTFALDYWRGSGLDPATFKVTNLAIHALTILVLIGLLRHLFLAAGLSQNHTNIMALLLATAWAIHPLQVSSVLYVVQRMQTLATLFLLAALWRYIKARQNQINGNSGRSDLLLSGMLWLLALCCKEDAILLPLYTLALELTILGFRAHNQTLSRQLKACYSLISVTGIVLYAFVVAPHFWSQGAYIGRDFSSLERLLSQGRVLCLYLWQIIAPLPSHMPFYYDWLKPSRSLIEPWTTLPALLAILALVAIALHVRKSRPIFAFGILFFFAGHFVASNVIGLELAFEHRNHLPMIGILLAAGDLTICAMARWKINSHYAMLAIISILSFLGSATAFRAHSWNSRLALAQTSAQLAPHSARAWNSLCVTYFELGGGPNPNNPQLGNAIAACEKGAIAAPLSTSSLTNLVIFKTINRSISQQDWDRLLYRIKTAPMSVENRRTLPALLSNASNGVAFGEKNLLATLDILANRWQFSPTESAAVGYYILTRTRESDRALPYFIRAIEGSPTTSPLPHELIQELQSHGKTKLANQLIEHMRAPNNRPN